MRYWILFKLEIDDFTKSTFKNKKTGVNFEDFRR